MSSNKLCLTIYNTWECENILKSSAVRAHQFSWGRSNWRGGSLVWGKRAWIGNTRLCHWSGKAFSDQKAKWLFSCGTELKWMSWQNFWFAQGTDVVLLLLDMDCLEWTAWTPRNFQSETPWTQNYIFQWKIIFSVISQSIIHLSC